MFGHDPSMAPSLVAICAGVSALAAGAAAEVTSAGSYYWPMAMGHPQYYSLPPWPGPTNLTNSFKWEWFGPTGKRYDDSFVGSVIDDKKNIYVTADHNVFKLSEDGALIWSYLMPGQTAADGPAIYEGKLFGATNDGKIFAVDMESGAQRWVTKASGHDGGEYSQLAVHQGVVVTQGDLACQEKPWHACACRNVNGLNATDGTVLWKYEPGEVLWDWFPQFPDDETVVFMSATGGLYRLKLQSGEVVWKAAGLKDSWTDGSQFVASNGLTYTVQVGTSCFAQGPGEVWNCEGYVTAYKTSDGSLVWRKAVPKPPNSSPVVGRLKEGGKPVLVMPIGQQSTNGCSPPAGRIFTLPLPHTWKIIAFTLFHRLSVWLGDSNPLLWGSMTRTHDVYAMDAETGEHLWKWEGPTTHRIQNRGDEDGWVQRKTAGKRDVCCPTPWGQPRIGADGTIFVANENGDFFTLRDANGDSSIDNEKEVTVYHTDATFPHCGSAHAPGMVVATNFDGVFVWKS